MLEREKAGGVSEEGNSIYSKRTGESLSGEESGPKPRRTCGREHESKLCFF